MKKFMGTDLVSPTESKLEAQKIAFAPIVFQVSKIMRDTKILKIIEQSAEDGIAFDEILKIKENLSKYSIRLLLDAGISIGLISLKNEKYFLTKTGYFILNDKITNIHMDFVHDVCYEGMFYLDEAIKKGNPAGLKVFGKWETIYEALSSLPEKVQESWFAFDHYFSDMAFPKALSMVFNENPKKILDVGGNTGKWAIQCAKYSKDTTITILDLPGQLKKAEANIKKEKFENRIYLHPINLLDHSQPFPKSFDAIWMSQLLDCFSDEDIVEILKRASLALNDNGYLYILETYPDRQSFDVASFCLDMISFYFTCMANGNSRMYNAKYMIEYVKKAGLEIVEDINGVAISHTLFKCKKKSI
jgi:ubiquinone/menaquinone biosynthesis C-methylase UbiE